MTNLTDIAAKLTALGETEAVILCTDGTLIELGRYLGARSSELMMAGNQAWFAVAQIHTAVNMLRKALAKPAKLSRRRSSPDLGAVPSDRHAWAHHDES